MSEYPLRHQPYPGSSGGQLPPGRHLEYAPQHQPNASHLIPNPSGAGGYLRSGQCSGTGAGPMSMPMPTDLRRNSVPSHGLVPTIENPLDQGGQASTPSPGNTAAAPSSDYSIIDHAAASGLAAPKPIRRRMRMITSCLECRRRKLKCNKMAPCLNCQKFTRDCTYIGPKLDEASQLKLTEMKEKVGSLERHFEQVVVKSATRAGSHELGPGAGGGRRNTIIADDINDELEDEGDLEPTPMIAADLTYEDDADGPEDIMDLGIRIGKMRITEKIGGMNRPRLSEEVCLSLLIRLGDRTQREKELTVALLC
jgi:hypothetical protein